MTYTILALICSVGQSPNECIPQTARSHYILGTEHSDLACMRQAQMTDAKTQLEVAPDEYLKFMCVR